VLFFQRSVYTSSIIIFTAEVFDYYLSWQPIKAMIKEALKMDDRVGKMSADWVLIVMNCRCIFVGKCRAVIKTTF